MNCDVSGIAGTEIEFLSVISIAVIVGASSFGSLLAVVRSSSNEGSPGGW